MAGALYFQQNRVTDANDDPVSGAKAYFYNTGTTTPQVVYTDSTLATAHPVPLVADSNGIFAAVWSAGTTQIKVDVFDANDAQLPGYPVDPATLQEDASSASSVAFTPTARIADTNVQGAIETVDGYVEDIEDSLEIEGTIYTTGGSSNAYTLTVSGVSAYAAQDLYRVKLDRNNTDAVTLNINNIGTKDVQRYDDTGALTALLSGDLATGDIHTLLYDGTRFVVLTLIRKSTTAQNQAGTATNAYPDVAGVKESIDALSPISGQYFESTGDAITSAGALTLAHSLSSEPKIIQCYLKCTTAEHGYSIDDKLFINNGENAVANASYGQSVVPDDTNLNIRYGVGGYQILDKSTGAAAVITLGSWDFYVRAWA